MRYGFLVVGLFYFLGTWTAFAHPGPVDACLGHTVTDRVEYPDQADGQPTVPSEPGEHHFQFTPEQMDQEVLPSLRAYRARHPSSTSLGIDHGSFEVNGRGYDIWEYTRQGEAIVHCQGDDEVVHTGIIRIRVSQ